MVLETTLTCDVGCQRPATVSTIQDGTKADGWTTRHGCVDSYMSTRRTIGVVGSVGRDAAETFRETAVLFVLEAMRKEVGLGDMSKICRRIMVAVQIYMYVLLPFFIRITYYTVVFREINCLNGIIMCCLHICKYYHPSQPLLARTI